LLAEAKKIALDVELNSFIDEATRGAVTVVLTMIYGEGWDRRVNQVIPPQSPNPTVPHPPSEVSVEPSDADAPAVAADDEEDEVEINVLILMSGEPSDIEELVKNQIVCGVMDDGVVNHYLEKIGIKPVKDRR
jgi:hypothetical protein